MLSQSCVEKNLSSDVSFNQVLNLDGLLVMPTCFLSNKSRQMTVCDDQFTTFINGADASQLGSLRNIMKQFRLTLSVRFTAMAEWFSSSLFLS